MKTSTIKVNILKATSRIEEIHSTVEDYFDLLIDGEMEATAKEIKSLKTVVENFREKLSDLEEIAEEAEDSLNNYLQQSQEEGPINTVLRWVNAMGYDTKSRNVHDDAEKLIKVLLAKPDENNS